MAFSPLSLIQRALDRVRRREAKDAFSGDDHDLYDDDEEAGSVGPRIALIGSGVLFLLLAGLGVTVYMMGKDVAPPPPQGMMALDGLKVEDEEAPKAPGAAAPTAAAPAPAPAKPVDVAATDRSTDRRPWLAKPGAAPPAPAPAVTPPPVAAAKPEPAKPEPAKAEPAKPEPAKSEPAKAEPPKAAEKAVAEKADDKKPAAPVMTPPPATAAIAPTAKPAEPAEEPAADAAMPSVLAGNGEPAPGAPDRFAVSGTLTAGGRPRLAEPALPPIDRKSLGAPPPRFANLAEMKTKTAVAKPDDKAAKTAKIAIVVQGLGLNQIATEAAVTKLPSAVALSFSPYARDLKKWAERAKARGHEVLVELPMESKQFPQEDPGPLGLMTSNETKENGERLDAVLRVMPGAIGVDDFMGSKFREAEAPMREVFTKLKERNLVYVQSRAGVRIGEPGVPNTVADVVADERPFRAAIDARLDYAERLAKFQGSAVTVMSAKPVSFERLALWLDQIDKKGLTLAPVSQVLVR